MRTEHYGTYGTYGTIGNQRFAGPPGPQTVLVPLGALGRYKCRVLAMSTVRPYGADPGDLGHGGRGPGITVYSLQGTSRTHGGRSSRAAASTDDARPEGRVERQPPGHAHVGLYRSEPRDLRAR